MYNCVGSNILGLFVGIFLGASIGYGIGWKKWISVVLVSEGGNVASLIDSNDVRGMVELDIILNKRWKSGVK